MGISTAKQHKEREIKETAIGNKSKSTIKDPTDLKEIPDRENNQEKGSTIRATRDTSIEKGCFMIDLFFSFL